MSVNGDLNWVSIGDVIAGNGGDGIRADGGAIDLDYARIDGNGSHGVDLENTGTLNMDNCRLLNNGGQGIQSGSPTTLNHCNLAFNGGTGLVLTGNNFHTLNNSILWGNNETNYTQIDIGGGVISTSYSPSKAKAAMALRAAASFTGAKASSKRIRSSRTTTCTSTPIRHAWTAVSRG